jgi:tetratricopeptide (TPR) repeat protein
MRLIIGSGALRMRTSVKEWIDRLEAGRLASGGEAARVPPAFSWDRWSDRPFREERIPGLSPFAVEAEEETGVVLGADLEHPGFDEPGGGGARRGQFPALLRAGLESRSGRSLYLANDLPAAADAFEAGIRWHQEANLRRFSPDLVGCWNGLGLIHLALERFSEAEICLGEARRLLETHDQSVSPEAIVLHNNLGCLHHAAGRFGKATEEHRCALEMRWLLGPGDNPALADAERNLALSAMAAGDGETAHRLLHEALRRGDRLGSAWHSKGIELLLCLAKLHDQRGEFGDAEMILIEAFNRHEPAAGAQDALTAHLLNSLGCVYAQGGFLREARRMFQKGLELQQKLVAGSLTGWGTCHANLGVIELELGGRRQAEVALRRAAGIFASSGTEISSEVRHVNWLRELWERPEDLPVMGARLLGLPSVYRPWPPVTLLIQGTAP